MAAAPLAAKAGAAAKAGTAAKAGGAASGAGKMQAASSAMDAAKSVASKVKSAYSNATKSSVSEEVEEISEEEKSKKDACYNKVKSRYKVWPSAYASGALVKCRQKGASSWGNKSKKEEVEAVFALVLGENMVSDEESALRFISHISDAYYDTLVEKCLKTDK